MAHYDIFREQLAIKYPACGVALWEPSPGKLYSPVEIGDVGFVRGGKFHRLFNALLPADDASQKFGVPEYHEPLTLTLPDHIDTGTDKPNHYYSHGISVAAVEPESLAWSPDPPSQVTYLCRRRQRGAVLFLPLPTQRQDTIAHRAFGQWMVKHINCWFAFTQRHQLGIEMEDIILVTGRHRTRSWAVAAFLQGQDDAQVSFGVKMANVGSPDISISWRFSPERNRGAMVNWGPDGKDLPEDQCVFIRGFRVTRPFRFLPKHLVAAAGPSSDPDEYNSEPDVELTSISQVATSKYRDPIRSMLEHVAKHARDCDIVLVHDDDVARLDETRDSNESFRSDAVVDLLEKSQPEIQQVQCDLLCVDEHSSKTSIDVITVAMFSGEFQEWGEPPPDHRGLRDSPSQSVQPPIFQAHPPSSCAGSTLPSISTEDPSASGQRGQTQACALEQRVRQAHCSSEARFETHTIDDSQSDQFSLETAAAYPSESSTTVGQYQSYSSPLPSPYPRPSGSSQGPSTQFLHGFSDGFLVRMFGHRDAVSFIVSLFKMNAGDIHLVRNVPGWPNALMVDQPSISDTRHDAVMIGNNQPLWLLDFTPLPFHHVVPQTIWTPPNHSDWRRYVEQANLHMPVFFVQNNGVVGLPLPHATVGDTASLRNSDSPAPLGGGHSTQIRIAWPGYEPWERQIQIRDQTRHRNQITLERFAKLVAGIVDRFLTSAATTFVDRDPSWRVGLGGIHRNGVIIVGAVQVSAGGWMPILQVANPIPPVPTGHSYHVPA